MRTILALLSVATLSAAIFQFAGCTPPSTRPYERQWQEGEIMYWEQGEFIKDSVSVALPHYHIEGGRYVEAHEQSAVHFHKSRDPNGPPNTYVRCFAEYKNGQWIHKPQWHELLYRPDMNGRRGRY